MKYMLACDGNQVYVVPVPSHLDDDLHGIEDFILRAGMGAGEVVESMTIPELLKRARARNRGNTRHEVSRG
jgi:hypothetical protein